VNFIYGVCSIIAVEVRSGLSLRSHAATQRMPAARLREPTKNARGPNMRGENEKLSVRGILAVALAPFLICGRRAREGPPIKVGEINSYTGPAAVFTVSYRKGFEMAVDEVNAAGAYSGGHCRCSSATTRSPPPRACAGEGTDRQRKSGRAGGHLLLAGRARGRQRGHAIEDVLLAAEPLTDKAHVAAGSRYVFRIRNPTMNWST